MSYDNTGVFGGRTTFLTLKDYLPGVTQPFQVVSRKAAQMARSQLSKVVNCVNLPHIGWQLQSYHLNPGDSAWLSAAQPGSLVPNATLAPNFVPFSSFSQQTISGVSYASGVQAVGTPMVVHRPPAGTDWSTDNLTADQAAFPGANPSEDLVQMLRSLVTPGFPAPGSVSPFDNLLFNILAPSASITPRSTLSGLYFNGPAGDSTASDTSGGTGQYELKLRGDGYAYLYEKFQSGDWIFRYHFLWVTGAQTSNWTMIHIAIASHVYQDVNGNYLGSTMTFGQGSSGVSPNQFSPIQNIAELALQTIRFQKGDIPTYVVPVTEKNPQSICPVRIDTAIDCRANFAPSKFVYQPSGTIVDDPFGLDQPSSADFYITWSGVLPIGSAWSVQMLDQNDVPMSILEIGPTTNSSSGQSSWIHVKPSGPYITGGHVIFTLTSSTDTFRTPTIRDYQVYGGETNQVYNPVTPVTIPFAENPPALWQQVIESVQVTQQQSDMGAENATIEVFDFTGALDFLEVTHMIPVHLWTTSPIDHALNPNGSPSTLFRGYCLQAHGTRIRTNPDYPYPGQLCTSWSLQCVGEWSRLADAILPDIQRWQQSFGPNAGKPSQVTQVVTQMLESVCPLSMVIVPSLPTTLFGTPDNYIAMPGTRCLDIVTDLMANYFGGWIDFDYGVSEQGAMRAFLQKVPPYNNLAVFEIDHPTILAGDDILRVPQWAASYATTTAVNGQVIQHPYIQAGTFEPHVERAEGNSVTVIGGGINILGSDAMRLNQVAINVTSYNFLNLSPTAPGFPDGSSPSYYGRVVPIRDFRPILQTQQAVDWYCRRLFDRTCFRRYFLSFTAPLILVNDVTDSFQTIPRYLRYYDPVQVRQYNGSLMQFLVVGCYPTYTKDTIQMARYILVTQENIDQKAVIPRSASALYSSLKAQARIQGTDMRYAPNIYVDQKQAEYLASEVMVLPVPSGPPIQDWDNASSTFGDFYFMPGYDSFGGGAGFRN